MKNKRIVLRNVSWNWLGLVCIMAAGFLTAPYLVRQLGSTGYGLWILIASFSGYFGLLDLGVRGAVGRQIAFHRARGDQQGVNGVLSTSLAFLIAAGALAFLATFAVSLAITSIFDVPSDQIGPARLALLLVGLNLALWLPLNVFDATLWANQRFDLINVIDIAAVLIRTGLTFLLIGDGGGLVTLACLNLVTQAGAQAVKGFYSFEIDSGLRIAPGLISHQWAREIFGYGIWCALLSASRAVTSQASPLIIGLRLGVSCVTPFSVATRLVGYAAGLVVAGTGVLTPVATTLHAEGNHDRQRWLFTEGGKYCLALSLFFSWLFVFLGRPLIVLWMGPELASASSLLAILAIGEALPMSQFVTNGMIFGMGRHREIALANFAECVTAVVLALLLAGPWGLSGVCVAFAVPGALIRGLFQMAYGCRLVGYPFRQYLGLVVAPAAAVSALPAAALFTVTTWRPPVGWIEVVVYTAAFGALFFTITVFLLAGPGRLKIVGTGLIRKVFGVENS